MRHAFRIQCLTAGALILIGVLLAACTPVDLNSPIAKFDTGVNPEAWATVPAGEFLSGQQNDPVTIRYDYEIMVTDVTVSQYVAFLNAALADGTLKLDGEQVTGFYPGDKFHAAKLGLNHAIDCVAAGSSDSNHLYFCRSLPVFIEPEF